MLLLVALRPSAPSSKVDSSAGQIWPARSAVQRADCTGLCFAARGANGVQWLSCESAADLSLIWWVPQLRWHRQLGAGTLDKILCAVSPVSARTEINSLDKYPGARFGFLSVAPTYEGGKRPMLGCQMETVMKICGASREPWATSRIDGPELA